MNRRHCGTVVEGTQSPTIWGLMQTHKSQRLCSIRTGYQYLYCIFCKLLLQRTFFKLGRLKSMSPVESYPNPSNAQLICRFVNMSTTSYPAILAKHLAHEVYPDTGVTANTRQYSLNIYLGGQSSWPETFRVLAI